MIEQTEQPRTFRLERRMYFRMTVGAIVGSVLLFAAAWWRLRALGFLHADDNPYCSPPIMLICLGGAWFGMVLGAGLGMFSATRDGVRIHTGNVRTETTTPDNIAKRTWRVFAICAGIGLAGFLGGYVEGRVQGHRKMVQHDLVFSDFIRVMTLVPVEVMEQKSRDRV